MAAYAALGRRAPAPRPDCGRCGEAMGFDGRYPRQVREAGVVHRIFIRRAHCSRCGVGDAVVPDFVLRGHLDSTGAVAAAVAAQAGVELLEGAAALYAGVPARTVRSWRQRFAERSEELWGRLAAVSVAWGGDDGVADAPERTPVGYAIGAIASVWRAARRRPGADVPPAFGLANVILGGRLISTRVDLPWPIDPAWIGRARSP
ncbi:MAG: DUF6431 domain-containing protein [Acidimicrobiales bacterium]